MEEVYPPENYGASERINLKTYLEEVRNILSVNSLYSLDSDDEEKKKKYISSTMLKDLPATSIQTLESACDVSQLTCHEENSEKYPISLSKIISSTTKFLDPIVDPKYKSNLKVNICRNKFKQQIDFSASESVAKRSFKNFVEFKIPPTAPNLLPGSELVISIFIYQPFTLQYFNKKNTSEKLRFKFEILALSSTSLIKLREAIKCGSDDTLCREMQSTSNNLDDLRGAKVKFPSSSFFIDNIFYNDLRMPNSTDYSTSVMKWAKEQKIKDIQTTSMENVNLSDLSPRFGYPYLFVHQGNCEHLLVFSDVRLLRKDDCLHSDSYPHIVKINTKGNKLCSICLSNCATWLCLDNDELPQRRVFLCTNCCNSYNYIDNEKKSNFKLYPYQETV